ncbi:ThiF family adenylyltransferase [Burkholderia stagnalis]|uniref:ThiF family adenylyltransferase n=1 Tax=Burkholderia stagnalis TaxID=1503054 RepID=UPI0009BEFB14|nr:ThiF family adenylyltransferase [Burkholderia stagnalis]
MPENQIARDAHVQRLVDEGLSVTIDGQYLIVDNVPYITSARVIGRGALISAYQEANGVGQVNGDHTVWFTGSIPHMADGLSLQNVLVADTAAQMIAGRQVFCRLSNKPDPIGDMLDNFYNKMIHYVRKLTAYARAIDGSVSASGNGDFQYRLEKSVFHYPNAAIARAGLDAYEAKLRLKKVAIVGLGGTGGYILDALAKTPVEEIHLYDGDVIEPHNAYRMPGGLTIEEAHGNFHKTDHLQKIYAVMRVGVVSHPVRIGGDNLSELDECDFVFIAVDDGPSRGLIARHLYSKRIPFIDVGIGVERLPETLELHGRARVTLVAGDAGDLVDKLPTANDAEDAVYNNIQLVELNSLNAMLAIVRYKQYFGFYSDEVHAAVMKYVSSWSRVSILHENNRENQDHNS